MKKVFVGGPIQKAIEQMGYNNKLKNIVIETLQLLQKADFDIDSALTEGYLDDDKVHNMETSVAPSEAVMGDYEGVTQCDIYVCLWPNNTDRSPYRSDGMCIELGWATASSIPCVLVRDTKADHSDIVVGLGAIGVVEHLDILEFQKEPQTLIEAIENVSKRHH